MKTNTDGSQKAFYEANQLRDDTCNGREPIWSDEEEAAYQAMGEATQAKEALGELLRVEALIREGADVPDGRADELRSRAHQALSEAAQHLEQIKEGGRR